MQLHDITCSYMKLLVVCIAAKNQVLLLITKKITNGYPLVIHTRFDSWKKENSSHKKKRGLTPLITSNLALLALKPYKLLYHMAFVNMLTKRVRNGLRGHINTAFSNKVSSSLRDVRQTGKNLFHHRSLSSGLFSTLGCGSFLLLFSRDIHLLECIFCILLDRIIDEALRNCHQKFTLSHSFIYLSGVRSPPNQCLSLFLSSLSIYIIAEFSGKSKFLQYFFLISRVIYLKL